MTTSGHLHMDSDFGYYNIIMNNYSSNTTSIDPNGFPNTFLLAEHIDNRTMPILDNQQDWQVCIERFKIPGVTIPLMIFLDNGPTTSLNYQSSYYIAFSRGPNDDFLTPAIQVRFTPQVLNNLAQFNGPPNDRFIFYYTNFLTQVNTALDLAWTYLSIDNDYEDLFIDGVTIAGPPYFKLDTTTNYIKIILPAYNTLPSIEPTPFQSQYNQNGINILMSSNLFYYFFGFPAGFYGANGIPTTLDIGQPSAGQTVYLNYRLNLNIDTTTLSTLPPFYGNGETNPRIPFYNNVNTVFQDYSSLTLWQTLTRIIITTDAPVDYENAAVKGTNGTPYTMNILTDYEIPGLDTGEQRQYLYYNAINERWLNFKNTGFLDRFNVRVFVQFNNLQTIPLFIPPTFECTIKVGFKRRKSHNLLQYSRALTAPEINESGEKQSKAKRGSGPEITTLEDESD